MPETDAMRAVVYEAPGRPFILEDLPDPEPGRGEVLLKVSRCGVCGSDLHMTSGHGGMTLPGGRVLGHEYAGEVVALGKGVEHLKVGDLVTSIPLTGCGACDACAHHHPALCANMRGMVGGFAEYVRAAAAGTIRLPQTVSLADGALAEPLAVGLHGVALAKMRPGARVLVMGGGAVALAAIFWARRMGAGRIAVMSRSLRRAALALEMGADIFLESGDDEASRVAEALGGAPELVIECIGVTGALEKCVQLAGRYGTVVSLGFCTAPDPVNPAVATLKEVRLIFSMHFTLPEFQFTVDTLEAGHLQPRAMISDTIALADLPGAIERLRGPNNDTKVQVAPWA